MVARNSRRKSFLVFVLVLGSLFLVLGVVWLLLRHEPAFYRGAAPPESEEKRIGPAASLWNAQEQLKNCFKEDGEPNAVIPIEAKWINCALKQMFTASGQEAGGLARQGISEPRIGFDKDRVHLGFRYRNFFMTSIISLDMRIWLVPNEINTFAIEILNRRAGALPFPTQALLEEISTTVRKHKFDVNWYRHDGHPVALVRVQRDGPRPAARFDRIDFEPGKMTLSIVANESGAGQVLAPPRPRGGSEPANDVEAQNRPDPKMLHQQASPTPQDP